MRELSFAELRQSVLVLGPGAPGAWPTWDRVWRAKLVDNLEVLTRQLWRQSRRDGTPRGIVKIRYGGKP